MEPEPDRPASAGRRTDLQLPTDPLSVQWANKSAWNHERSRAEADFYTVHYGTRTLDEVLATVIAADVATVIDIRHVPVSRYKPDFSKSNLRRALEAVDVAYLHLPELGIPRDVRGLAVGKPDRGDLWAWYDANVASSFAGRNVHRFLNLAEHPVALMCVEVDPTACHRHRLGLALERRGLRGYDL